LPQEWKESIIVPIHKKAITWTVIIIEEFHFCLLHIKVSQTYFYLEQLHMQIKLQENINVGLGGIDQSSTTYLAFGKYLREVGVQ
jgi:hypothetical protein